MKKFDLNIGEKAKEYLYQAGTTFHLYEGIVGSGWSARSAVLVGNGKPENGSFFPLIDDDITVWIPENMEFVQDIVDIQAVGFLWNTYLVAASAVTGSKAGCGR